jgi:hypothetical protein
MQAPPREKNGRCPAAQFASWPVSPESGSATIRAWARWALGVPTDHIEMPDHAMDLLEQAERDHDRAAADQAIWMLTVVALAARDHPLLAGYRSHLGTAWANRFGPTGRKADLGNAIGEHRTALALPPVDPADRAGFRANYSAALFARYEATGDLDQAVALAGARHAGHARPAEDFALSVSLQGLAAALLGRFAIAHDRGGPGRGDRRRPRGDPGH